MQLTVLRSDKIYREIAFAPQSQKDDLYRNQLMKPFEYKYACVGIPLKAEHPGGFDVVTSAPMGGGYRPADIDQSIIPQIDTLSDDCLWNACEASIHTTLEEFKQNGIPLPVQDYIFTLLLTDPKNPMAAFTTDCCGDGGIPGYITGTIIPGPDCIRKMPVVLAHETNHNIRWQHVKWSSSITLADMIVSEGLAEAYEAYRYGEEMLGPWASAFTEEEIHTTIAPLLYPHLKETDFQKISSYLYGDGIMSLRGVPNEGIPDYAGYSLGYHLIRHYLNKAKASIHEATITPTDTILQEVKDFWNK